MAMFGACSDEDVAAPDSNSGAFPVEIGEGTVFDITIEAARGPAGSIAGPFRLSGTSLGYSDSLQALLVDLMVTNESDITVDLPVVLTFLSLHPQGVTVNNSDNGESGPGAQIDFHFVDRDIHWTPGEVSQPRTVEFGVDPGTSIGFTAELLVGFVHRPGTISGRVWHDHNENGIMDHGEPGLVTNLVLETDLYPAVLETASGSDGRFAFNDLAAGTYTLHMETPEGYASTTPDVMFIVLEAYNGVVGAFEEANFGCRSQAAINVGDWLDVYGTYSVTDGLLYAIRIDCVPCPCDTLQQHLVGPVTGIDDRMGPAVMGVQVWTVSCGYFDPLEVGDRASLCCFWNHHAWGTIGTICPVPQNQIPDEVHGYVTSIQDGVVTVLWVPIANAIPKVQ
jgi:hypothetical protein